MDDVIVIQPSGKYVLLRMLVTLFAVETVYAMLFVLFMLGAPAGGYDRAFIGIMWVVHALKFILLAFLLADIVIRYLNERYYVTKHHLIVSRGIIGEEEKVIELNQLRKLSSSQDFFGRKLGYGSVVLLLGARGYEETVTLKNVVHPKKIVKKVEQYLGTGPENK